MQRTPLNLTFQRVQICRWLYHKCSKTVFGWSFYNTHSSDPALISCFGFIQTKAMFWFRGKAWEKIASGKKEKQCKPPSSCSVMLAVDVSVTVSASEEPEMTAGREISQYWSTQHGYSHEKHGGFVQQDPSEEDLSHPVSQPPAGAGFQSNTQLLMALNDTHTHTEPSSALLCRCIVAKRQDGQTIHRQPWSQTHREVYNKGSYIIKVRVK